MTYQNISPVFPTVSLQKTAAFYKEKMFFDISYLSNYLVVSKENIRVFYYEEKDIFYPASCFIFLSNIEDAYAKFSSAGLIEFKNRLCVKPGNLKEFIVEENNGHQIRFGEKG